MWIVSVYVYLPICQFADTILLMEKNPAPVENSRFSCLPRPYLRFHVYHVWAHGMSRSFREVDGIPLLRMVREQVVMIA